ncbi:MAG: neutral/alkaline non-lysosomal ceramidase N-terminal domain-containing protein, partial [Verrucomicrobiota bacterium]
MISRVLCRILFALLVLPASLFSADDLVPFGVAKIDITPDYPIRLTGYASRKTESEGVAQKLWAKAIAIGSDRQGPAILITVDNCGVCANVIEEIASRLKAKIGLPREKLVVASSHTHTGPMITGFAPNIFAQPIPEPQLETIARYTRELTDKIEQAALAALNDRKPARLFWSEGQVGFAANRRNAGGPKDHALPVLCARDAGGKTRAVLANYACHCTTLGGEFNKLCGDWAGFAQEFIEADHPGALALITIGCGADSNPQPRGGPDGGLEWSRKHGQALAAEVNRLLAQAMTALRAPLSCKTERVELPFQKHFTREQWEERARRPGIVGYHAQRYLARLDRGEPLPATLPYLVQRWNFGEQLALVFLGGEVVVDYVLALKKQFDPARLWVTAYANDVPCYIPSKRILNEGGYEAEDSLWYYDRPQRLAPETEEILLNAVGKLMPEKFRFDEKAAEFPPPKSPQDSLATIRTKAGLIVELVASEPLVVDPVAIDWGPDGRLWVVEMRDFPLGIDGKWKPGGRVKFLEDLNGDGVYERATVFLDEIPFPTGVTAWRKGVLVCAAPDILYAEDTNGDGKADVIKKLFSGFATENYQARVNSLQLGLDNWIYGANGLIGGRIRGLAGDQEINISGRDFRMNLDTGAFEPAAGLTQQGRVRDDFDNWFGCDNSTLLWHYPLPDHYVRRNPHVAPPDPRVNVCADGDPDLNQLFPISRPLRRFNDPHHVNRVTSACGLGIYRDTFLGEAFYGNAFVCEPVH